MAVLSDRHLEMYSQSIIIIIILILFFSFPSRHKWMVPAPTYRPEGLYRVMLGALNYCYIVDEIYVFI